MPGKTLVDIKNGYYETFVLETDKNGKVITHLTLYQAAVFSNIDSTITLATTAYKADEQCYWHVSDFYEISKTLNSIKKIEAVSILPEINWENILVTPQAKATLKKHLPQIKKQYLDSTATLDNVINEVYNTQFVLPKKGSKIKMILTPCDYIPVNLGIINPEDWEIVAGNLQSVEFSYNRKLKRFTRK